ncbi:sigma-54 dependent transcriptional regulator [Ancylomarina sp. DW003]|nr:sigma-54 dependent transcriptional regulator [Ancylomarina sp. DW003]MDE5424279.1 sigma-54 dependent transcriptional regulator [Ancylomarina sp. DW003]
MSDKLSTLILDDDPLYLKLAATMLEEDFVVYTALSPFEAFELLLKEKIDVLICDFNLPEMNGVEVLKHVKEMHPETDVIMISGSAEDEHIIAAFDLGAIDFLKKPIEYKALKISIERGKSFVAMRKKKNEIEKHNSFLTKNMNQQKSPDLVYCSESMRQVHETIDELAKDDRVSVLVSGEIGLYKDSIARRIHMQGRRREENFASVNMVSVTDVVFEKKFFGYNKSVVRGDEKGEVGWLEVAQGGTLYLDEIAGLSVYQQGKLNSLLQNKKFTKIGAKRSRNFDVRLISSCTGCLDDLKEKSSLRMDLIQKLCEYDLYIPPLRERQEDIPLLMSYFIRQYADRMRKAIHGFDPYTERKLIEYSFPGNTRELSNLIERAVILCNGRSLNLSHFPSFVDEAGRHDTMLKSFDLGLIEREVIIRALKECNYNKAHAAKLLNLSWNALHRRLQKFDIDLPEYVI